MVLPQYFGAGHIHLFLLQFTSVRGVSWGRGPGEEWWSLLIARRVEQDRLTIRHELMVTVDERHTRRHLGSSKSSGMRLEPMLGVTVGFSEDGLEIARSENAERSQRGSDRGHRQTPGEEKEGSSPGSWGAAGGNKPGAASGVSSQPGAPSAPC